MIRREAVLALGDWTTAGVFNRIAWRCERTGTWTATIDEIAADCWLTAKQVRRALDKLRDFGWIEGYRRNAQVAILTWRVCWTDDHGARETAGQAKVPSKASGDALTGTTPPSRAPRDAREGAPGDARKGTSSLEDKTYPHTPSCPNHPEGHPSCRACGTSPRKAAAAAAQVERAARRQEDRQLVEQDRTAGVPFEQVQDRFRAIRAEAASTKAR